MSQIDLAGFATGYVVMAAFLFHFSTLKWNLRIGYVRVLVSECVRCQISETVHSIIVIFGTVLRYDRGVLPVILKF